MDQLNGTNQVKSDIWEARLREGDKANAADGKTAAGAAGEREVRLLMVCVCVCERERDCV